MPNAQAPEIDQWWRGAVIYQIYPRSFYDSNNDGLGDIEGITRKLDYIAALGVDAIWISPFFKSPMKDFGYDVADYRQVDPMFGDLIQFQALIDKAHRLDLKVIIDMVISHSSDQHPWFETSRRDRSNPRADWYVWADPKPDGTPPSNWQSVFGGPAWQWEPQRKQYYLHNFLASQPDLNLHNPDVQRQLLEEFRFWLDLGIDGFRLDTVNYYFHDPELRDNPPCRATLRNAGINPYNYQEHEYDKNQAENIPWLRRIRALLDSYDARMLIGEIGDPDCSQLMGEYTRDGDRLHTAYSFQLLLDSQGPAFIRDSVQQLETDILDGWPTWALSNHDSVRVATRWASPAADQQQQAQFHMALLLGLRGSLCIYQGEELGLPEAELTFEQLQDPQGITFWPEYKGRDGCRTPIPWIADRDHGGFSGVDPWLPVPPAHCALAVDRQQDDPRSMLNFTRALLAWRQQLPQLVRGDIGELAIQGPVLSFERQLPSQPSIACLYNFSAEPQPVSLPAHAQPCTVPGMAITRTAQGCELPAFGFAFFTI